MGKLFQVFWTFYLMGLFNFPNSLHERAAGWKAKICGKLTCRDCSTDKVLIADPGEKRGMRMDKPRVDMLAQYSGQVRKLDDLQ